MRVTKWGLPIVALLAACSGPSEPELISMAPAVGAEKAKPLAGAHEINEVVDGKNFKLQMKFEEGKKIKQMLYTDGIPQALTEFLGKDHLRITWYDSAGEATYITEHKFKKGSVLGRCLQLLLPQPLMAQTLTQCASERSEMNFAITATAAASLAMKAACTIPASPACVAATATWLTALSYAAYKTQVYESCMSAYGTGGTGSGGGGGGGGFLPPPPPSSGGGTGGGGGGGFCSQTVYVFDFKTGNLLYSYTIDVAC